MVATHRSLSCVLAGLLWLAAAEAGLAQSSWFYQPMRYREAARASLCAALQAQADRGRQLELTVWNHYFEPKTAELTESGRAMLDRFSRRYAHCGQLFLETARDLTYEATNAARFDRDRAELNAKRLDSVATYLRSVHHRELLAVQVHDPGPVGMTTRESHVGVQAMILQAPKGFLTRDLTAGLLFGTPEAQMPGQDIGANPGTGDAGAMDAGGAAQ